MTQPDLSKLISQLDEELKNTQIRLEQLQAQAATVPAAMPPRGGATSPSMPPPGVMSPAMPPPGAMSPFMPPPGALSPRTPCPRGFMSPAGPPPGFLLPPAPSELPRACWTTFANLPTKVAARQSRSASPPQASFVPTSGSPRVVFSVGPQSPSFVPPVMPRAGNMSPGRSSFVAPPRLSYAAAATSSFVPCVSRGILASSPVIWQPPAVTKSQPGSIRSQQPSYHVQTSTTQDLPSPVLWQAPSIQDQADASRAGNMSPGRSSFVAPPMLSYATAATSSFVPCVSRG